METVCGVTIAALVMWSPGLFAAVYKCTDARGKVSFQQQPCPQESTGAKLDVDNSDWVLLNREDTQYYLREKSVDIGHLKNVGKYLRAPMREKTTIKGPRAGDMGMQRWFVYYDCAEKTISQQVNEQRVQEFESQLLEDPREWKMRDPGNIGLEKACARAASEAAEK